MRIFAISDLHLSFTSNKPMDKFGEHWYKHHEKIAEAAAWSDIFGWVFFSLHAPRVFIACDYWESGVSYAARLKIQMDRQT
jgi:hypothetical protein